MEKVKLTLVLLIILVALSLVVWGAYFVFSELGFWKSAASSDCKIGLFAFESFRFWLFAKFCAIFRMVNPFSESSCICINLWTVQ